MQTGEAYNTLGLKAHASPDEIRRAYRALVKKYHPDKNHSPEAKDYFLLIQEAYDHLCNPNPEKISAYSQKDQETATAYAQDKANYEQYREQARAQRAKKKAAEEAYKIEFLRNLKTSWKGWWHRSTAFVGLILFIVLWVDFFLPEKTQRIFPEQYANKTYQSIDGHAIQLFFSTDGRHYWISDYFSQELGTALSIHTKETHWLRQVKNIDIQEGHYLRTVPVHFTFYWAQIWVSLLFLVPFISWFWASADIIFVAGSYFSRLLVSPILFYFLCTENRWLHLLSFGTL